MKFMYLDFIEDFKRLNMVNFVGYITNLHAEAEGFDYSLNKMFIDDQVDSIWPITRRITFSADSGLLAYTPSI